MLLMELSRLTTQHRTLCCYTILSLWILLLIMGMYINMPNTPKLRAFPLSASSATADDSDDYKSDDDSLLRNRLAGSSSAYNHQLRRSKSGQKPGDTTPPECSPIESIAAVVGGGHHDDGGLCDDWQLLGVLLLLRHGDRGPMVHVRNVRSINCGPTVSSAPAVERYRGFLANATVGSAASSSSSAAAGDAGGGGAGPGGRLSWPKTGAFHGNPLLPALPAACLLGQLTYKGIAQLLRTGELLRQVYSSQLGLHTIPRARSSSSATQNNGAPPQSPTASNNNNAMTNNAIDDGLIDIYSTRYRRTFQSAMAFMFGLVAPERWLTLNVRESHSVTFCFDECICPLLAALQKSMQTTANANWMRPVSNATGAAAAAAAPTAAAATHGNETDVKRCANAVSTIGQTLLENPIGHSHPLEVRDALLSVLCHGAKLPCRSSGSSSGNDDDRMAGVVAAVPPAGDAAAANQNDFINIDQEEDGGAGGGGGGGFGVGGVVLQMGSAFQEQQLQQQRLITRERLNLAYESSHQQQQPAVTDDDSTTSTDSNNAAAASVVANAQCVRPAHVAALLACTARMRHAERQHPSHRQHGQLRAYGMLRHMLANMLRMISGLGSRFVLYAGHDRTLEAMLAALGVDGAELPAFVPYAARLAVEVYRSRANGEHYFRIVYQGRDITAGVHVCAGSRSLHVSRQQRRSAKAALCPIENIIRFVHEDYFAAFNASNYREACQTAAPVKEPKRF